MTSRKGIGRLMIESSRLCLEAPEWIKYLQLLAKKRKPRSGYVVDIGQLSVGEPELSPF